MTYSLEDLATLFNVTVRTFRNKMPELLDNNFPRKLPGSKIWSKPQVDMWIATNGGAVSLPNNQNRSDFLTNAIAELDEQYGASVTS